MPKLRNKIARYLILIAALFSALILIAAMGIRTFAVHEKVRTDAKGIFEQIERILPESRNIRVDGVLSGKNDFAYVLSVMRTGIGGELYAVDTHSGLIVGATDADEIGRSAEKIGLTAPDVSEGAHAEHVDINGQRCYCVFDEIQGTRVIYAVTRTQVYSGIVIENLRMAIALLVIASILVLSVMWYVNRYVIRSINRINKSLEAISMGNLDAKVETANIAEFAQLSSHINDMINSLLSTTDILSYIINKTDVHIGVYVYNVYMKYVRFTDYIPELLNLEPDAMTAIASDYNQFKAYIRRLRSNPIGGEKNIYKIVVNSRARYIRIEEAMHHHDVLGVVVDMTAEIEKRRRIESERDMDLLTGLLNRRGIKSRLYTMFKKPEELGYGAIFMIDADDLKMINDTYGHSYGDRYLKALADVLSRFGSKQNLAARLGGDEFVVFLYGYENEEDLKEDLNAFVRLQDMIPTQLGEVEDEEILIHFSLGYALTYGEKNYSALLHAADEMMYENKRKRKGSDEDEVPPLFR